MKTTKYPHSLGKLIEWKQPDLAAPCTPVSWFSTRWEDPWELGTGIKIPK